MNKLISSLCTKPWAIEKTFLETIYQSFFSFDDSGDEIEAAGLSNKFGSGIKPLINGDTAVIPIHGIITKYPNALHKMLGIGTSVFDILAALKSVITSESVKRVILDIDSPGGSVDGIDELSAFIYKARSKKQIIAYTNGQMLSAAYWIGSSAHKVYATSGAQVGSVGVYSIIQDCSVMEHNAGVQSHVIKSGRFKAAGHPSKPLTEDERAYLQRLVNTYFDFFVGAVKRNRNISEDKIQQAADGRSFIASEAFKLGLIDGLRVLDDFSDSESGHASPENNSRAKPINDVEGLRMAFPSLVAALEVSAERRGKTESTREVDNKIQAAVFAERSRVKSIFESAYANQERLVKELIVLGVSTEEAKKRFDGSASLEQKLEREWRLNPSIRNEFSSMETFIAFSKAKMSGRVRL